MTETSQMYESLAKAQAEFKTIRRNKTVSVRMDSGGTYNFAYAPLETILEAIMPSLNAHGFSLTQDVTTEQNGAEYVVTYLRHPSSLDPITSRSRIIPGKKDGPQAYGSATTYARRYGVTWLFCLSTDEDDDGNAAEGNETTVVKQAVVDDLTDPSAAVADRLISAAQAGIEGAILEISQEANHDHELFQRAWRLIPSKERAYIKKVLDESKKANGATA